MTSHKALQSEERCLLQPGLALSPLRPLCYIQRLIYFLLVVYFLLLVHHVKGRRGRWLPGYLQEGPVRPAVSWREKESLGNGNENILHLVNKKTLLHDVTDRKYSHTH